MNGSPNDISPCKRCKRPPLVTDEVSNYDHVDPCLGVLPGVVQACCGHGCDGEAYVVIAPDNEPGTMMPQLVGAVETLRGSDALAYFWNRGRAQDLI